MTLSVELILGILGTVGALITLGSITETQVDDLFISASDIWL